MPSDTLAISELAKQQPTRFGVGFSLAVGTHTLTLEPRRLWTADELKEGTFHVGLPKDDARDIGSFADFWKTFSDTIHPLPPVEWDKLPDPLDNLATADVVLREFELDVEQKRLTHLLLDVTLETNWDVPGLEHVTVNSLSLVVDVKPQHDGGTTMTASTATTAGSTAPAPPTSDAAPAPTAS